MKEKYDILFGFHSVTEALKAKKRKFHKIFLSKKRSGKRSDTIEKMAKKNNIPIEWTDPAILDKLTQFANHQGIAASTSNFPTGNATEVAKRVAKSETPCFILVVENMEDPHNLGALIRTALCAGVDYILVPKDRSATPSSAISRSSAGAMEHADIFMITNTSAVLRSLKEVGVWVSGLDADGDKNIYESDLTGHIALVIGGEHKGIRPLVKKECDFLLSIPNLGKINSLNASVAGGIAMFEALRQRT
ncbi:MAG: 23S rRNA (guanosine(2251)-2'-O)-methyltransferase RlmB [Desulfobacula sp.]|nr:23S rRNA (guanosine(2251)-2'-O)-methyltransferase RlmB [Desulfobacula sp.]